MLNLSVGGKGMGDGMQDLPGDEGASRSYQTVGFLSFFFFSFDFSSLYVFSLFFFVSRLDVSLFVFLYW